MKQRNCHKGRNKGLRGRKDLSQEVKRQCDPSDLPSSADMVFYINSISRVLVQLGCCSGSHQYQQVACCMRLAFVLDKAPLPNLYVGEERTREDKAQALMLSFCLWICVAVTERVCSYVNVFVTQTRRAPTWQVAFLPITALTSLFVL